MSASWCQYDLTVRPKCVIDRFLFKSILFFFFVVLLLWLLVIDSWFYKLIYFLSEIIESYKFLHLALFDINIDIISIIIVLL